MTRICHTDVKDFLQKSCLLDFQTKCFGCFVFNCDICVTMIL